MMRFRHRVKQLAILLYHELEARWEEVVDESLGRVVLGTANVRARRALWRRSRHLACKSCVRQAAWLLRRGAVGELGQVPGRLREALLAVAAGQSQGDEAMVLLWQTLLPRVQWLARQFAGAASERQGMSAEDLEQEAFLKFGAIVSRYDAGRASLWVWLRKVLTRLFIQICRGPDRSRSLSADAREGDGPTWVLIEGSQEGHVDSSSFPEEVANSRERGNAVHDVCWRMLAEGYPGEEMRAFRLRYLEERTLQDTATQLGRSLAWVHRAVLRTREVYAGRFAQEYPELVRSLRDGE